MQLTIKSAEAMEALGAELARLSEARGTIYLSGDLGTGKTTLVRGLLRGLGHEGAVKSPTFTIVEPYLFDNKKIYHFDLYRLADPEELELLGGRDYFAADSLCLVEWPDCAEGSLPEPDLLISLQHDGTARQLSLSGLSDRGRHWCQALSPDKFA